MTTKRRVHFGIDYGTSNSKIVVRDFEAAGGEQAHVLSHDGSERFSSSVAVASENIFFGFRRTHRDRTIRQATWYESVKMCTAGETLGDTGMYRTLAPLPPGLSARDLTALTIWWLITEASRGAEALVHLRRGQAIAPGMTIGIPMSFYRNNKLRSAFVDIARAAWLLFKHGPRLDRSRIGVEQAKRCLPDAYQAVQADPIPDDEVRFWVRSEAEAALWWAFRSPQIPEGPYAKVDIGAGTTNASVFRIVAGRPEGVDEGPVVKLKMAFFGADSKSVGMDQIDDALAQWKGTDVSRVTDLRGREDRLLQEGGAQRVCRPVFTRMHEVLCEAWRQNGRLNIGSAPERKAWIEKSKIFLLGGGSLVRRARELIPTMPFNEQRRLPITNLESPPDLRLDGRLVPSGSLPFVLVAYGLSVLAPPIPTVETPDEIPPMPRSTPMVLQLSHEDLYAR